MSVYIQSNSSKSEICGEHDGALKIKIASPAVDGKANKELINFLAKYLKLKKNLINIKRGETSRHKILEIFSDKEDIDSKIKQYLISF
ncbi:DUF167 domain-containing protein [Pseudofrancisella aestuarii]|uniref:UPF0235 protein ACFPDQ_04375 n=1 Tax=Pseudofrancisella aestuarii TaxID=2670347 RepID=A0ABV9TAW2_9GAMM|nr:DUF167 domain-containing protein [Pseudofrancisella aestuarii]